MRVIIAGSRYGCEPWRIGAALNEAGFRPTEIVSGAATNPDGGRSVDELGEGYALRYNIPVKRFPADWKAHGKSAGPKRNREMATYASDPKGPGGALLLLWDGESSGSASMKREAERAGLKIHEHRIPPRSKR